MCSWNEISIHRAQGIILYTISENQGATQSEIAEILYIQGATVTNAVQRLEENGLVRRQRDDEDQRLVRVYLTDEGQAKAKQVQAHLKTLGEIILEGIPESEHSATVGMIEHIIENLKSQN